MSWLIGSTPWATYKADLRELNELNYTRFDAKLDQRLAELRAAMIREMDGLRVELHHGLAELRQELAGLRVELHDDRAGLHQQLASSRVELIRWMFGFWVTTLLALAGALAALRGH